MPHSSFSCKSAFLLSFACVAALFPSVQANDPELTVYNQNFALVKDHLSLSLKEGINQVSLDDVAALIDPTSVHVKSLTAPDHLSVSEQNFRYDLISKSAILNRMVGKRIRFKKDNTLQEGILLNPVTSYTRPTYYGNGNPYAGGVSEVTTNQFAVQTNEGVLLTDLNDILVDTLPKGLYPKPTLVWELWCDKPGVHQSEVSYLTDGVRWWADYVAVVDKDDRFLDLTGWVTLDNQSGASYENATLKLVAGDVRRVSEGGSMPEAAPMMANSVRTFGAKAKQFVEESLFEYHLYTLDQKTTLENRETKQLKLVSANHIPVEKHYVYDPSQSMPWRYGYRGGNDAGKIQTRLQFDNKAANNLGIPLPKGTVRLMKADNSGALQFIGEDSVDHTPKDESLNLYVGDAFDLVADKVQTASLETSDQSEQRYEVTLKNHKQLPVTIEVIEHLFGNWRITQNSLPFVKKDANTIRFSVSVPPGAAGTRLSYTVIIKHPR